MNNRGENQALKLDLYEPAGDQAPARPAIVWAHGGGFRQGSRTGEWDGQISADLARHGFVVVSIDYRLRPTGTPDAYTNEELTEQDLSSPTGEEPPTLRDAQHDMQAAVRWLRAHGAQLRIDPSRIASAGGSAGAVMAIETAENPEDPCDSGNPGFPSDVEAAISVSGMSDARRMEPGNPPLLMFHGTNDTTNPFPLAAQTCAFYTLTGNVCEPVYWPGEGHVPFATRYDEIVADTSDFLCRRMLDGCPASG